MVKEIQWWVPQIGISERRYLDKVLRNNFPNEGEMTALFEKKLSDLLAVKYVVAITSGTAAIFLALKALGVGHGDEVIVPDITFIATVNAVNMCGAKPVLADIDPFTMNISTDSIARAITGKTKAVIPVYVSGRACAINDISRIARRNNISVIEDAAEAFMSKHNGKYLGTFGKFGCFSFSPNKTITTGQGGAIVTDDEKMYIKLRELKDQGRPKRGTGGDDKHDVIGYNFKFTDLQASLGLGQLGRLASRTRRMRRIYQRYEKNLRDLKELSLFKFNIAGGEVPQWTDCIAFRRNELVNYLASRHINCRRYWFPIHSQKPYRMEDALFPNSTKASLNAFWLPSAFTMTDKDVDYVSGHIVKFYSKRKIYVRS